MAYVHLSSLVVACVVQCVLGAPVPQGLHGAVPPLRDGLELQRLGGHRRLRAGPRDYTDAIYAGQFAIELGRLEKQRNQVFSEFIMSGFISNEVPRDLPQDLQPLSRSSPSSPPSSPFTSSPFTSPFTSSRPQLSPASTFHASSTPGFSGGFVPGRSAVQTSFGSPSGHVPPPVPITARAFVPRQRSLVSRFGFTSTPRLAFSSP